MSIFVSITTLSSCYKRGVEIGKNNQEDLKDLPSWVSEPSMKEGIAAVGIASPSKGGIKFQIPKAELDAKANIAAIIQSNISRLTKDSMRSAQVNENEDIEQFFAQATKEVVKDLPLSGVRRLNIHKTTDGTLYVRMILDDKEYKKFLEDSKKTLEATTARSNMATESINKVQAASKVLFDELDKERGKTEVKE